MSGSPQVDPPGQDNDSKSMEEGEWDEEVAPVAKVDDKSTTAPAGKSRLKVTIQRWHAVAVWKWDVDDDLCGICRQAFDACCPTCHVPGDSCPPVWGACNHAFHMHCIMKWLVSGSNSGDTQRGQHCPICRRQWEFRGDEDAGLQEEGSGSMQDGGGDIHSSDSGF